MASNYPDGSDSIIPAAPFDFRYEFPDLAHRLNFASDGIVAGEIYASKNVEGGEEQITRSFGVAPTVVGEDTGNVVVYTVTGTAELSAELPNATFGREVLFIVKQDATGSRTVTVDDTNIEWFGDPPTFGTDPWEETWCQFVAIDGDRWYGTFLGTKDGEPETMVSVRQVVYRTSSSAGTWASWISPVAGNTLMYVLTTDASSHTLSVSGAAVLFTFGNSADTLSPSLSVRTVESAGGESLVTPSGTYIVVVYELVGLDDSNINTSGTTAFYDSDGVEGAAGHIDGFAVTELEQERGIMFNTWATSGDYNQATISGDPNLITGLGEIHKNDLNASSAGTLGLFTQWTAPTVYGQDWESAGSSLLGVDFGMTGGGGVDWTEEFTGTAGANLNTTRWTDRRASGVFGSGYGITLDGVGAGRMRVGSAVPYYVLYGTQEVATDFDGVFMWDFVSGEPDTGEGWEIYFRTNGVIFNGTSGRYQVDDGYRLQFWRGVGSSFIQLYTMVNGEVTTFVDSVGGTVTLTGHANGYCRIQCVGDDIKIRVWYDADPEPGTWDIEVTDTTFAGSRFAIGGVVNGTDSPDDDFQLDWTDIFIENLDGSADLGRLIGAAFILNPEP